MSQVRSLLALQSVLIEQLSPMLCPHPAPASAANTTPAARRAARPRRAQSATDHRRLDDVEFTAGFLPRAQRRGDLLGGHTFCRAAGAVTDETLRTSAFSGSRAASLYAHAPEETMVPSPVWAAMGDEFR